MNSPVLFWVCVGVVVVLLWLLWISHHQALTPGHELYFRPPAPSPQLERKSNIRTGQVTFIQYIKKIHSNKQENKSRDAP